MTKKFLESANSRVPRHHSGRENAERTAARGCFLRVFRNSAPDSSAALPSLGTGLAGWGRRAWTVVCALSLLLLAAPVWLQAGTVGRVAAIGGHASDLALDEGRGVLYVANFTANRIDVMSLSSGTVQTSYNVAAQPSSLALSPDGRYLVVTHYGNFAAPNSPNNGVTVLDLTSNRRQSFVLGSAPLGVGFGIDNQALIVTSREFMLLDPVTGNTRALGTIESVTTQTLPQPLTTLPTTIVAASVATSGDGLTVVGSAAVEAGGSGGGGSTLEFIYDVTTKRVEAVFWTWAPPPGPRAVSVSYDGKVHMTGWAMHDRRMDVALSQFHNNTGSFDVGTHVFDSTRGRIYAQFEEQATGTQQPNTVRPPVLLVLDADNLAVREKLNLKENFTGKSVLNSDGSMMYGLSESGIQMVPVGDLSRMPRVVASRQDLVFRGNFCDRTVNSQEVTILDPGGGNVDFTLSVSTSGISVAPAKGTTPATVRVSVDPNAFQNQKGTISALITITSATGVNQPKPIRVLANNREPDQRGTVVNVPGTLVDLLNDPIRDRFYILRQDTNEVLVFDGRTQTQIATFRTANVPTQMAITFDRRYLMVGHDAAQIIKVFDLETFEDTLPIRMPSGHYPRTIAASAKAILVGTRVAGPIHKIDRVDFASRTAVELPTLGVYENDIDPNIIMVASPNGSSILAAMADGRTLLYSANSDTFTVARKNGESLSGAYAASNFDQFVIGNRLLNASLVPVETFETGTGRASGFAFLDQGGFRTTAPDASSPGIIQRVEAASGRLLRATRMVEAPLLAAETTQTGSTSTAWVQRFTRTVAPLYSRNAVINLTTSGFTVLPWQYDAETAAPRIERVVNAADTGPVAPGSLISIYGSDLSPVNQATQQMPLPTALGESCLTVNGLPVPVLFVSPSQINGQIPFQVDGNVTMVLRTPGGVSNNFNITILPNAPGVFRSGTAGTQTDLPTVFRATNNLLVTSTNPVHRGDYIVIYLTGLGRTSPSVDAGVPAPSDPLATTIVPPTVTIGGVAIPVEFAGLVPGSIGVYQINARVTSDVPLGLQQPLTVSQGSGATTINVRVVN